jgi:toxin ParE1/3/4
MTQARLTARARRDLLTASNWIAQENPNAAEALRASVATATQRLGDYPDLGASRPELATAPYRFLVLTGFPYVLVYNAARKPPLVLRILHGARDFPELLKDI